MRQGTRTFVLSAAVAGILAPKPILALTNQQLLTTLQAEVDELKQEIIRLKDGQATSAERKLQAETEKLAAETRLITAVDPEVQGIATVSGALGSLVGALLAFAGVVIGVLLNRAYTRAQTNKLQLDENLTKEKHLIDRHIAREKHNLELFQGLGTENTRIRFASAAVLLQCLERIRGNERAAVERGVLLEPELIREVAEDAPVITQVLLAVIKDQDNRDNPGDIALRKHIADNLVKAWRLDRNTRDPSPLADYDMQNAVLRNVYWRRINLQGVDLFRADLREAGLREARLRGAVLMEADLRKAVLRDADLCRAYARSAQLQNANLGGARLEGADFLGANCEEVTWTGATYDEATIWPLPYFDPAQHGLSPSSAKG